ncbi:hypothetical protein DAETH_17510 [Deinococcus aetherius]|uniref:Uncharacterized protein n=1 Tax=Deinococcus aetherius TaxID=200252 RepID=A0ABN6RJL5_9DEIO|nr:hypothetical protein [Deinococcus aetherius]BDP41782.1 hypothetical protein DAETH_17510 [Deinococcus aetherius]
MFEAVCYAILALINSTVVVWATVILVRNDEGWGVVEQLGRSVYILPFFIWAFRYAGKAMGDVKYHVQAKSLERETILELRRGKQ